MGESNPRVSILMPAYNAVGYIKESVDSILKQTFSDLELVICDDASIDNTYAQCLEINDKRVRLFKNDHNLGYLKTCNFLFGQARGEWIGFQDADDISDLTRVEKQIQFLNSNPDHVLCGTRAWYFERRQNEPVRYKNVEGTHEKILKALYHKNQFCGASVLVKKSVLYETGGYQIFYDRIGNEDYDCFFRIAQRFRVANLEEHLYFVRLSPNSVSRVIRNPKQLISGDLVLFFAHQRDRFGKDSLTGLPSDLLDHFLEQKLARFIKDPSFLYRKNADMAAYNGNLKQVWKSSLLALKAKPFLFVNWKYFISGMIRFLSKFLKPQM